MKGVRDVGGNPGHTAAGNTGWGRGGQQGVSRKMATVVLCPNDVDGVTVKSDGRVGVSGG